MTTRLEALEIEAFRGFNEPAYLDLSADAIVLSGSNGSGKTSFVDALCWVLTGDIPLARGSQRHRDDEVVLNRYSSKQAASVVLHLTVNGTPARYHRTGTSRAHVLNAAGVEASSGEDAEQSLSSAFSLTTKQDLALAVDRWVLRQDELRAVLQATPNELHERLKDILSLGALDRFEAQAKELAAERTATLKEVRASSQEIDSRHRAAIARVAEVQSRIELSPDMAPSKAALAATLDAASGSIELLNRESLESPTASLLGALRAFYEELKRLTDSIRAIKADLQATPPRPEGQHTPDDVQALEQALMDLRERAATADMNLARARDDATARAALAAAALPFLEAQCPVCQSAIDMDAIRLRLEQQLATQGGETLVEAQATSAVARDAAVEAEAHLRVIRAELEAAAERERAVRVLEDRLADTWVRAGNAASAAAVRVASIEARDESALPRVLEALASVGQAMRTVLSATELSALQRESASAGETLRTVEVELVRLRSDMEESSRRSDEAARLLKASRQAVVTVLQRAMASVNPSFSEVYRRLAPHPTFTDLGFAHDVYYAKGRAMPVVIDPLWELTENPAVVCSIGQLNVIALSYFLAFALAGRDDAIPFVVMDDPLQSLDDVNALGFADFCRRLKRDRQIVVTSHDPQFTSLLERKLAPRTADESAVTVEFHSWERRGPRFTTHRRTGHQRMDVSA